MEKKKSRFLQNKRLMVVIGLVLLLSGGGMSYFITEYTDSKKVKITPELPKDKVSENYDRDVARTEALDNYAKDMARAEQEKILVSGVGELLVVMGVTILIFYVPAIFKEKK